MSRGGSTRRGRTRRPGPIRVCTRHGARVGPHQSPILRAGRRTLPVAIASTTTSGLLQSEKPHGGSGATPPCCRRSHSRSPRTGSLIPSAECLILVDRFRLGVPAVQGQERMAPSCGLGVGARGEAALERGCPQGDRKRAPCSQLLLPALEEGGPGGPGETLDLSHRGVEPPWAVELPGPFRSAAAPSTAGARLVPLGRPPSHQAK
jgi:hypothetical protein